jgi:PTS system nitrogen regulatory IIA component
MRISDILSADRVACRLNVSSKKGALEELAQMIASGAPTLGSAEIFESLIARERLGSTGLGHGVAIPHGRLKNSDQTLGAFALLARAVDYDAIDQQPVDLLFALTVPQHSTDEHLEILARLAEMFSDAELVARLRNESTAAGLFKLLTS